MYYYSMYKDVALRNYGMGKVPQKDINQDLLAWVLYEFFEDLEIKEFERLLIRNEKIK